jgi:phosphohistidine phosphatase SixA
MKKLIVVRHGDCLDGRLSDLGRKQITMLCGNLAPYVNGGSVVVIASPALRALESAEIIGQAFNAKIEQQPKLCSDELTSADMRWLLELVRAKQDEADVIILLTHFEYVGKFPGYFARKTAGFEVRSWEIEKGGAWVIDCKKKKLDHVWAAT